MIKLVFLSVIFLLSLLVLFRAPTSLLWYVSILVTEFSWVLILLVGLLLFWQTGKYPLLCAVLGGATVLLLLLPYWQAWRLARTLPAYFQRVFPGANAPAKESPFNLLRAFTGIGAKKVKPATYTYDAKNLLTLDFYPAQEEGNRPCVVVVHGGSWAGGDGRQLPDLNSEMAKWGYAVASISYRLAPAHRYPASLEDVQKALRYLQQQAAKLSINPEQFVLLGRSAGGQIALSAAYTLNEPAIKGVIDFYGPTDMVWGYANPTNPLVLDSRKIMEDYLGGTYDQVPAQYEHSSATETATRHSPPTLMIYAEHDPLVSPRHGTRLHRKLVPLQVPFFELYLPWATHGFDYTLNGPGGQLSTWTVKQFLDAILNTETLR